MKKYVCHAYSISGVRFYSDNIVTFSESGSNPIKTFYQQARRWARTTGKTLATIYVNGKAYRL